MRAKSRRRRLRVRFNPGPLLFLILLANIGGGLAYSKITSPTKVRVLGAPEWDRVRIGRILDTLQDKPWRDVNPAAVESAVLQVGAVRTAKFDRNIFGRGELRLTYRVPVAVLNRPNNVAIDREGVFFTLHEPASKLPRLVTPTNGWVDEFTIEGSWPRSTIAEICDLSAKLFTSDHFTVDASNPESVSLVGVQGGRVIFGRPDKLTEKFDVLSKTVRRQPELLSTVAYLNISSPDNPATFPKEQQH